MSDFPTGGNIQATRDWLDNKGFTEKFIGWEADEILGKSDDFIKAKFDNTPEEQERAERLCGRLNRARQISAHQGQGKLMQLFDLIRPLLPLTHFSSWIDHQVVIIVVSLILSLS